MVDFILHPQLRDLSPTVTRRPSDGAIEGSIVVDGVRYAAALDLADWAEPDQAHRIGDCLFAMAMKTLAWPEERAPG
jgi:hypothetical protein